MIQNESKWVASELRKIGPVTILNVGSSTLSFRQSGCIQRAIIDPHESSGGKFIHLDLKQDEGVDLVGDFFNDSFQEKIKSLHFGAVLCSNFLEHVTDAQQMCSLLMDVTPANGYLVITVPRLYPYHPYPIDTMFRPSVRDLELMMPELTLVSGEEVASDDDSFAVQIRHDPKIAGIYLARTLMPFYKPRSWKHVAGYWPHTFKKFKISCVVFRRP